MMHRPDSISRKIDRRMEHLIIFPYDNIPFTYLWVHDILWLQCAFLDIR